MQRRKYRQFVPSMFFSSAPSSGRLLAWVATAAGGRFLLRKWPTAVLGGVEIIFPRRPRLQVSMTGSATKAIRLMCGSLKKSEECTIDNWLKFMGTQNHRIGIPLGIEFNIIDPSVRFSCSFSSFAFFCHCHSLMNRACL